MKRLFALLLLLILPALALGQGSWSRVHHQDQHATKDFDLEAVTHGAGRFVAVGSGNGKGNVGNYQAVVMASADGTNWSDVTPDLNVNGSYLWDVIYADGRFVAVGNDNTQATGYNEETLILTSGDGLSWSRVEHTGLPLYNFHAYIAYGAEAGRFVLVADTFIYSSSDLVNWSASTLPSAVAGVYWNDVAYGDGRFVTVGRYGGGYGTYRMSSSDGASWSIQADTQVAHNTVEYLNGGFVNTGAGDGLYRSDGAASWEEVGPKLISATTVHAVDYANGTYLFGGGAVGSGHNGGYIWVTSDFRNWWQQRLNGERNGGIASLAHDASGFVGVSDDGMIFHSPFSSSDAAPRFTSARTINAALGEALEYTVGATGLPSGDYFYHTYNLDPDRFSHQLPDGLSFSYSSGVGMLSGTPTAEESIDLRFSIKPRDTSSDGWRALEAHASLVIGAAATPACSGRLLMSDVSGANMVDQFPTVAVGETLQLVAGGISCTSGEPEYQWGITMMGADDGSAADVVSVSAEGLVTSLAPGRAVVALTETVSGAQVTTTIEAQAAVAACAAADLEACATQAACSGAGGYWNFDWCGAEPQSDPSHHATYCAQGYSEYCDDTGEPSGDDGTAVTTWIAREGVDYQSAVSHYTVSDGYRLDGGAWSNGRPNASGESDGNGVQSSEEYDFVGRTAYLTFKVHGAGQYAAWWARPRDLPSRHFNSHHSWADGLLIPDDTWLYASYQIGDDGAWSMVLAEGNYADQGGDALHRESGTLTAEQLTALGASPFLVTFTDNYGGSDAYMVVREARLAAATVDTGSGCRAGVTLAGRLHIPCVVVGERVYDARLVLVPGPELLFELDPSTALSSMSASTTDHCMAYYDTFHGQVYLPCVDVAQPDGSVVAVWATLEPSAGGRFRVVDFGLEE